MSIGSLSRTFFKNTTSSVGTYFHGTTAEAAKSIVSKGFEIGSGKGAGYTPAYGDGVYITNSLAAASYYAKLAAENESIMNFGEPISPAIVRVSIRPMPEGEKFKITHTTRAERAGKSNENVVAPLPGHYTDGAFQLRIGPDNIGLLEPHEFTELESVSLHACMTGGS